MFWKNKSSKPISSACSVCGRVHDGWPALGYGSPSPYHDLTAEEREKIAHLDGDFCTIEYADQTDRFIRVVLRQKVVDCPDTLDYGLWVSLSEASYKDYWENYDHENHIVQYFGWLSSRLPDYENTMHIPTTVVTKIGNERPEIFPHEDFDHPFVRDYYQGISKQEAEKRIHDMLKDL